MAEHAHQQILLANHHCVDTAHIDGDTKPMPQTSAYFMLSLTSGVKQSLYFPDRFMQRHTKRLLVGDFRLNGNPVHNAQPIAQVWLKRTLSLLLAIAFHAGVLAWLMQAPAKITQPEPKPIQIALITLPVQKAAPTPQTVPLIKQKQLKHLVVKSQQTPVQKHIEQPVPVARIVETANNPSKFEARQVDSAPPAETLPAAAPIAVVNASSATPKPEIEEKEEPPKFGVAYLNNPAPEYPRLSKRAGEQGKVFMKVLVSTEGLPASVEVSKSSNFERLDAAAVNAVKQWRFEPARKGGKAISAFVIVPLSFTLN